MLYSNPPPGTWYPHHCVLRFNCTGQSGAEHFLLKRLELLSQFALRLQMHPVRADRSPLGFLRLRSQIRNPMR